MLKFQMKVPQIWLFIAGFLLATSPVHGKNAAPKKPPQEPQLTSPQRVDLIFKNLPKAYASPSARAAKKAYDAYIERKYAEGIRLATRLQNDDNFFDYGYWISSIIHQEQSTQWIKERNFSAALESATKAKTLILQIESRAPYSPFIKQVSREMARSELIIGEIYFNKKNWSQAIKHYGYAFHRLNPLSSMNLVTPEHVGHYAEACSKHPSPFCMGWVQRFTSVFAKNSTEIKKTSAHFPSLMDRPKLTQIMGKSSVNYKSPDLDFVAFDAALKVYFAGNYKEASTQFRIFLETFPKSVHRLRARFLLARSLESINNRELARNIFEDITKESPLNYYGLMASLALGKEIEFASTQSFPLAMPADPSLMPRDLIQLKRAQQFLAEGANILAGIELKDLKYRSTFSNEFIAFLTLLQSKAKNYNLAFQNIGELIQREYAGTLSDFAIQVIFPIDYLDLIKKYSKVNSLDPVLVLSLIKQESALDEGIDSSAGAIGLMQLMPATAADTDSEIGVAELRHAEKNIRTGTKYLSKLLARFNGNIVYALASYNAGPNAVDRWIKEFSSRKNMFEFIESIPYKETREYVASIIRNYHWYSKRLSITPQKKLDYFWTEVRPAQSSSEEKTKPQNENA